MPFPETPQVTGNEAEDFNNYVNGLVEAAVNKKTATAEPAAPAPITMNIGGQPYTFANAEEAANAVNTTLSQYQAALQAEGNEVTGNEATDNASRMKFDTKAFIEKMTEDPVEAFNLVDRHRFGVDNPAELIKTMASKISQNDQLMATYQFKEQNPDYVPSPQSAGAIDRVMKQVGLPFTADGLQAAYLMARQRGLIPNEAPQHQTSQSQEQEPQYQQYAPPANKYMQAPPTARRSQSAALPDYATMAQDMSREQIEELFAKLQ